MWYEDVMGSTRLLHHDEATGRESAENFPSMSARTGREYMFAGNLKGASQRYILRRQFLLDNNLRFLPGVYHEDGDFGIRMTYLAQSCYVLPDPVYVYRLRKTGSIMSSRKQKMNTDLVTIYQGLLEFRVRIIGRFAPRLLLVYGIPSCSPGNKYLLQSLRGSMQNLAGISIKKPGSC